MKTHYKALNIDARDYSTVLQADDDKTEKLEREEFQLKALKRGALNREPCVRFTVATL
jgi:hypothetical protein